MTSDKQLLEQALEALEPFSTPHWAGTGVDKANEAITSLRAAIASYSTAIAEAESRASEQAEKQEQAPVQYSLPDDMYDSKDWRNADYAGRVEWLHTMYESSKKTLEAYTAAQPAPAQEQCPNYDDPMREEMWKIGFNAAQRQSARSAWVELTDEELEHLFDTNVGDPHPRYPITLMDWVNFARAIEAKLKAKNSP